MYTYLSFIFMQEGLHLLSSSCITIDGALAFSKGLRTRIRFYTAKYGIIYPLTCHELHYEIYRHV